MPKNTLEKYQLSPTKCATCNSELPYSKRNNKFCNSSCSAISSNKFRNLESRNTQSITLLNTYRNMDAIGKFTPVYRCVCHQCRTTFFSPSITKKYCGTVCRKIKRQFDATQRSNEVKQKMKIGALNGVAKRVLRSKDEVKLFELCYNYFENVTHNIQIINGWDADIILNNEKIAILWNGPWHYKQMPHKNHSLSQVQTRDKIKLKTLTHAGWKVLIFEDRSFTVKQAFAQIKLVVSERIELSSPAYETRVLPLN
jgi:hypothetical protein